MYDANVVGPSGPGKDSDDSRFRLRQEFYARIATNLPVIEAFEHLSGVHFFLKDARGRMIAFNSLLRSRIGIPDDADVIGTTDYDLFPRQQADHYLDDDRHVLTTGRPLINRLEAWRDQNPVITSKYPVRDDLGNVIGIMGIFQQWDGRRTAITTDNDIDRAVKFIRAHLSDRITVEQVAANSFLSERQLRRRFDQEFGVGVQEFIIRLRIEAAGDELRTTTSSIADIAHKFGFCDQAAFTRHFHQRMGLTPRKYRNQHH